MTQWGAGGHIGKQQVLGQSGRLPEPPPNTTASERGKLSDWLLVKTDGRSGHAGFAKDPVRVHLARRHMTGDVSDKTRRGVRSRPL